MGIHPETKRGIALLLEVEQISKLYKQKRRTISVVRNVSFSLRSGEIVAFLGPNGAGKTTTIKMVAGLVTPSSGTIFVDGVSVAKHPKLTLRAIGAVLEGSRNLYWRMTALENIQYWGGLRGLSRTEARKEGLKLLDYFGLSDRAQTIVQHLSRGMQQQVAICSAFVHKPKLLLLDEPTLGLDLDASDRIKTIVQQLAREYSTGILLTTHQMEVAQAISDRVIIMNAGEVVAEGQTDDMLESLSSSDSFDVSVANEVPSEKRHQLQELGAQFVSDHNFLIQIDEARLHIVYRILDPLPVTSVQQHKLDLADAFRHYTHTKPTVEAGL